MSIARSSNFSVAGLLLLLVAVIALTAVFAQADDGINGGGEGEMTAMVDAIKYLQGLDKVYGQAARPRHLTSMARRLRSDDGGEDVGVMRMIQMKQLENNYEGGRVRPRFGKRGRPTAIDLEELAAAVRQHQGYY